MSVARNLFEKLQTQLNELRQIRQHEEARQNNREAEQAN